MRKVEGTHIAATLGVCILVLGLFLVVFFTKESVSDTFDRPPNIIFILADDLGYQDVGFRNPDVVTPNMDKLAQNGVIFTNSYSQVACTPSRHALMTGRYPHKTGMQNRVFSGDTPVCSGLDYKFLPQYLKALGYNTHALGKWHLGDCKDACLPTSRGFDSYVGLLLGGGHYWNHTFPDDFGTGSLAYDWFKDKEIDLSAKGIHSQDLMVKRLTELFDEHNTEEPLFLYFAPQHPHDPGESTENFLRHYSTSKYSEKRRQYLGLVSGLDYMIGRLVDMVTEKGMLDNTYIIFQSDNGADALEGVNTPYRGGKGSLYEGGSKVVSFISSPLLKKTGYENDEWLHITDWLPTLVALAGGEIPSEEGIDGIDQTLLVLEGDESVRTSMVYNIDREFDFRLPSTGEIGVRLGRYKLIWGHPGFTDGYGDDLEFIFNIPYCQQIAETQSYRRRKKRGGPYVDWSQDNKKMLKRFADAVRVTDEHLSNGTGYMQLYDLKVDPAESVDLSKDPVYQEVLEKLIAFAQDEIENNYQAFTKQSVTKYDMVAMGQIPILTPGWCETLFP